MAIPLGRGFRFQLLGHVALFQLLFLSSLQRFGRFQLLIQQGCNLLFDLLGKLFVLIFLVFVLGLHLLQLGSGGFPRSLGFIVALHGLRRSFHLFLR